MESDGQDMLVSVNDRSQTPLQGKSVPPEDQNLSVGDHGKLRAQNQQDGLHQKRSSHAFVATSLGDESFIQPPSPIHQNEAHRIYDSKYNMNTGSYSKRVTQDDNSGSDITFIKQGKPGN